MVYILVKLKQDESLQINQSICVEIVKRIIRKLSVQTSYRHHYKCMNTWHKHLRAIDDMQYTIYLCCAVPTVVVCLVARCYLNRQIKSDCVNRDKESKCVCVCWRWIYAVSCDGWICVFFGFSVLVLLFFVTPREPEDNPLKLSHISFIYSQVFNPESTIMLCSAL